MGNFNCVWKSKSKDQRSQKNVQNTPIREQSYSHHLIRQQYSISSINKNDNAVPSTSTVTFEVLVSFYSFHIIIKPGRSDEILNCASFFKYLF